MTAQFISAANYLLTSSNLLDMKELLWGQYHNIPLSEWKYLYDNGYYHPLDVDAVFQEWGMEVPDIKGEIDIPLPTKKEEEALLFLQEITGRPHDYEGHFLGISPDVLPEDFWYYALEYEAWIAHEYFVLEWEEIPLQYKTTLATVWHW